jgi:hypothetical protein
VPVGADVLTVGVLVGALALTVGVPVGTSVIAFVIALIFPAFVLNLALRAPLAAHNYEFFNFD